MRRKSIAALTECVARVDDERDYNHVLDPAMRKHALRVAAGLRDERPDVAGFWALGRFHWYRYRVLGPKGRKDREIAVFAFARCLIYGDEPLPHEARHETIPISI
ncbi:hypothetical protein ACIHFD_10845 [Nonomuraea sp. NPDC051941]|uniref:hypothetical protein n=1 Tax=Nonomuraea sp. NPDC051941 TaxID=3364373 RepID=UPI0037C7217A